MQSTEALPKRSYILYILFILLSSLLILIDYFSNKESLREASTKLFEQIKYGKIKIEIFKKYKLNEVVQAHKDLEDRKIIGPAIIIP